MQDAGIHVLFGVEGLKVHSKLTHISSPKGDIACISTGNFHEGNAKLYTDTTLFTADRRITREVDAVFDFIRHPYRPVVFRVTARLSAGHAFRMDEMIDTRSPMRRPAGKLHILCKVNHITDDKIIRRLGGEASVPECNCACWYAETARSFRVSRAFEWRILRSGALSGLLFGAFTYSLSSVTEAAAANVIPSIIFG